MRQAVLFALVAGVSAFGPIPVPAEAAILINEILADPAGDANQDGSVHTTRDEFIELVNTGPDALSLMNWTLADAIQTRHTLSAISAIPGYGFFVVFGGGSPTGFLNAEIASTGSLGLNNPGDVISLYDAGGLLTDQLSYGAEGGADASLTRSPDGIGLFVQHLTVSPGAFSPGRTIAGVDHLPFPESPEPELPPSEDPHSSPVVPEPSSFLLLGTGLLWGQRRRFRLPHGFPALLCAMAAALPLQSAHAAEWTPVTAGFPEQGFQDVAVHPRQPAWVVAASEQTMYASTDGGKEWQARFQAPTGVTITRLAISHGEPPTVLAATTSGLYGSFDGGATWTRVFRGTGEGEGACEHVAFDPEDAHIALLGTSGGLFQSTDGGQRWREIPMPAKANTVLHFAFDPQTPSGLYVVSPVGLFHGSAASGTWEQRFSGRHPEDRDPPLDDAAAADSEQAENVMLESLVAVAVHPREPTTVYLASSAALYRSTDGGRQWEALGTAGLPSKAISSLLLRANSPVMVFAGTPHGVARYDVAERAWRIHAHGPAGAEVRGLAVSEDDLWAATDQGLFRYSEADGVFGSEEPPSARDLLSNFVHEPTIAQVQDAAIRYAEVHPDKIKHWRRQAVLQALLPSVDFGLDRDASQNVQIDEGSFPNFQVLETNDRDTGFDVSVNWDLGELIWNDDQTSIDTRSKLMVQLRDDIVDEVTRAYFERRRIQVRLITSPPGDQDKLLEHELRLQELTALIDGLTGGYFSQGVRPQLNQLGG